MTAGDRARGGRGADPLADQRQADRGHGCAADLSVVAAERGRATALDGRHDLELAEANVTGIGTTPSGSVVAEDIGDLQGWTAHGCGALT